MQTTMNKLSYSRWPWFMLVARLVLFVVIQALFALVFLLAGYARAWENSANWWPVVVTIANLICITLLIWLFKREGKGFWHIFHIQKEYFKSDILVLLGTLIVLGPVSFLPNMWLGGLLFGDPQLTLDFILRPLPFWAVNASIFLFPVSQGMAELATYFSYAMPKLEMQGVQRWLAVTVPSLFLAFQHIGAPLLFDTRYLAWRGLMFLPFAFLVGVIMHWRPRMLPYLAVIHVLMDMAFAVMLLNVAY
jgi:hypothetical protein